MFLRHCHRLHGGGVRSLCGSVRRRCCWPILVSDYKSQRRNALEILTARKSVNADCGPRMLRLPLRRPVMVAKLTSRLGGMEGGGDARTLHRAVVLLWCCNVAMKKQGLGEKHGKGRWQTSSDKIIVKRDCLLRGSVARDLVPI